ncbi:MAG: zf-HC2 domain-containing protein [Nitrospirota bacterium]
MKSEHDEIKDMLHEYLHGTLSDEKVALVKEHLSGCDDCALEVNIAVALLKIEVPDPGAVYFNNLTKTVLTTARANTPKKFNLWNYIFRPIPIAAAASLCLVIYLTSLGNFSNSHPKQVQIASNTQNNITRNYITHNTQNTNIVMDTSATDDTLYSLLMEEDYDDGFISVYGGYDHEDDSYDE